MSPIQFAKVLDFVYKHHKFALYLTDSSAERRKKMFPKLDRHGFGIKYVDSCYDSRDNQIWLVKFREYNRTIVLTFTNNDFPKDWKYDLYEWCMAYLKGEWIPTEEFVEKRK